jgi:hypothetical protein
MTLQFSTPHGPWPTYVLRGDTAKAKAAYQDFLTLWKDADPDIPILMQAKLSMRSCSSVADWNRTLIASLIL